jgi:hypothetical protein
MCHSHHQQQQEEFVRQAEAQTLSRPTESESSFNRITAICIWLEEQWSKISKTVFGIPALQFSNLSSVWAPCRQMCSCGLSHALQFLCALYAFSVVVFKGGSRVVDDKFQESLLSFTSWGWIQRLASHQLEWNLIHPYPVITDYSTLTLQSSGQMLHLSRACPLIRETI